MYHIWPPHSPHPFVSLCIVSVYDDVPTKGKDRSLVATLLGGVFTYFLGLLPPGAEGVFLILESDCGETLQQQYTYIINGGEAKFLGHGDLHDAQYNYLEVGTDLGRTLDTNSTYGPGNCRYSIRAYPSDEFEDHYLTNQPIYFTIGLVALFLFTSIVFLTYDYCVERRQRVVYKSAQRSGGVPQFGNACTKRQKPKGRASRRMLGIGRWQTCRRRNSPPKSIWRIYILT